MSAPTALESGALARGIAWFNRPARAPHGERGVEQERRASHGLSALSRTHDDLCRQACDPLEIAAVLESSGLTDSTSRADYRATGVFDVAERLWQQVPWRSAPDGERTDPWLLPLWRSQLRGVLYAVPAVMAALAPAGLSGGLGYVVLALATAVAIAATQALSVLGHILGSRGQSRALSQLATVALLVAVAGTAAGAAACLVLGWSPTPALASGGQLTFVVASTLLMVRGADRLLLALLAPGAVGVLVELSGWIPASLVPTAYGLLAVGAGTVVLTAAGAWVRLCRSADVTSGEPLRRAVGRVELSHAGVAGLYGLGLSALVTFAVIGIASGRVAAAGGWVLLATVPLTATVGLSEYVLHRARGACVEALGRTRVVGEFSARARVNLRRMVTLHAATVAVLAAIILATFHRAQVDPALSGYAVGYAVLSVALLLSTTLLSLGYGGLAAALVCGGGTALLLAGAVPGARGESVVASQVGVIAVLLAVAYRLTVVRFTTLSVHR